MVNSNELSFANLCSWMRLRIFQIFVSHSGIGLRSLSETERGSTASE
jgi:hypothetical protein